MIERSKSYTTNNKLKMLNDITFIERSNPTLTTCTTVKGNHWFSFDAQLKDEIHQCLICGQRKTIRTYYYPKVEGMDTDKREGKNGNF